ncbi:MAG: hypothetical protein COS89_00195 [Deltaproteobacteria bacterium CG07_land_8_20_14_0_80_38_7]|nr:MAG: hypothetical protein COS89_00195 [Deltaproteobacteria bacterium CG07_land_8_20_14_0_80_38_7]
MSPENNSNTTYNKPKNTMGQYYLIEEIAQGGMAKIYKGLSYDAYGIKKNVVIKKILPHIAASKDFIEALVDEAKIAVNLSHGNIAQTYDLGKSGDDYFIVMEYVEGKSLSLIHKRCLANGKLIPIPILCQFMCEALNGLDYIHRKTDENGKTLNIVHRDISPQNLMVNYSGTLKIIDFGIAKSAFKGGSTDSGTLKGKFPYMSPEQARGDPIDHRSDIFSLGVIFHELLTGKRLFKAEDNRATIRNVRRAHVEPPSSIHENIPEDLDKIVIRALSKERRHRYAFASDMRDDLLKFSAKNFSDFKSSDIVDFLANIFEKDEKNQKEIQDSKTPVQILEHTTSALNHEKQLEKTDHVKLPSNLKEFFLDDMEADEEPQISTDEDINKEEKSIETDSKESGLSDYILNYFKKLQILYNKNRIVFLGISAGIILLLALALTKPWQKEKTDLTAGLGKTAELLIITEPADIHIYLDNKLIGVGSPMTLKNLKPNEDISIRAEHEGFSPQTENMALNSGEFRNLKISMSPLKKSIYTLSITSNPTGATIFLNDKEASLKTPATINNLEVNKHYSLGLYLEGYKFWSKDIETKENETQNFEVQLELNYGSLYVMTQPSGALILLNGTPAGQAPIEMDKLEPHKVYRLEAWLEGYKAYYQDIEFDAGKRKEMHLRLEKEENLPEKETTPSE